MLNPIQWCYSRSWKVVHRETHPKKISNLHAIFHIIETQRANLMGVSSRCTVDPQMGSAAMKGKKQGCVNRSSLEHSMVITLVRSEFELEAIWLLFYGWTALLKWQKWKNDENRSKSPSILREIIFPENRLIADFFCSIPSNRIQMEVKKWLASYVSVFRSSHGQNLGRANNLICIL